MSRRPRVRSSSGVYHIMLRGANRQEFFHDDHDRIRFLDIMTKYKREYELSIYGWCLMDNHVHLLIKEGTENISNTMKRIGVSFVYYYNRKYKTSGHLFQDRFRSENLETQPYLLTVIRYIHQNPLKAGMVKQMDEWRWSSYSVYSTDKPAYLKNLLDASFILSLFSENRSVAMKKFKEFNNQVTIEPEIDEWENGIRRLTDEEARGEIMKILGSIEIAQVKSLPKIERNQILQEMKSIEGVSRFQLSRILGVSPSLVYRALRDGK